MCDHRRVDPRRAGAVVAFVRHIPRVQLYIDHLPPLRWVRRLVDRLLAHWYVSRAEHEKLLAAFHRADRFRSNWSAVLFESQAKHLPRDERREWFRTRHVVRVNDTLYDGWAVQALIGPAAIATAEDKQFRLEHSDPSSL